MYYENETELELQGKVIPQNKPLDFDAFWRCAVEQVRNVPLQIRRKKLDTPYHKTVTSWEISYNTHDDTWIDAYFSYPAGAEGKLPCVVYFHGGSGQKGLHLDIVATGVACFAMDVRGQGGTSIDKAVYNSGCINGGLMTQGIMDQNEFYMRNIFMDAIRAMDVVAQLEEVDPARIVTYGGSQGGALSLVASAFSGHSQKAYIYVPSYSCLKQRTILGSRIFGSTHGYLKMFPEHADHVFTVLSYFDINNLASFLTVPSVFCLGLADDVCLPHFVYSVYQHVPGPKEMHIYPFTPHCEPGLYRDMAHKAFSEM